jgi:acetyl-CoA carboxylase carboxyl transferase subunit beta
MTAQVRDWRAEILADIDLHKPTETLRNRIDWPGYDGAVAVRWGSGTVAGVEVIAAVWDFSVHGGSFGERDATAFAAAADEAARTRRPLVSFLRSGGTRLQEGVPGLLGLPRVTLALTALARAGVGHVAIADHPTTGGAWVAIGSQADVRAAVAGATIGFVGPRVMAAVTGQAVPPGRHTAESAYADGIVDAVLTPGEIPGWLEASLTTLAAGCGGPAPADDIPMAGANRQAVPERSGWAQVVAAREGTRPDAGTVLAALLPLGVDLSGRDRAVVARLGRFADGGSAVGVALAGYRGGTPGAAGYRLLTRAARLADRLRLPLVTLVDTPGADPSPAAESDGVAAAIGEAMAAVLTCTSPTVSLVVGEGGSGGALAAACTDTLLVGADSYLTALSPEGSAATLRITPDRAADVAGLRPTDLTRLGIADGIVASSSTDTTRVNEAVVFVDALTASVRAQAARDPATRIGHRYRKWSTGADGAL